MNSRLQPKFSYWVRYSAHTPYPIPYLFDRKQMWGVWGCNVPDSIVRRGWGAVPQSFLGDRQTMYLFTDGMGIFSHIILTLTHRQTET
eukprot:scaffold1964_cov26-Cyclotella_meneghiniana.AAC.1